MEKRDFIKLFLVGVFAYFFEDGKVGIFLGHSGQQSLVLGGGEALVVFGKEVDASPVAEVAAGEGVGVLHLLLAQ